jgi:predicted permease
MQSGTVMADIIGLVLPFFGMIFLGALTARITRQPIEAMGWLNTFIIYIAAIRPKIRKAMVAAT